VAALLLLCAGVPLTTLAGLTIWQTGAELDARARERLRYESRLVAQEALGRLNSLGQSLDLLTRTPDPGAQTPGGPHSQLADILPSVPSAVVVRSASGATMPLVGQLDLPPLTAEQERHLDDWGRLIVRDADQSRLVLVVGRSGDTARAAVVLDPRWIFGLDEPDSLPPDSSVCVVPDSGPMACSPGVASSGAASALARLGHTSAVLDDPSGPLVAWLSGLNLDASYLAPSWRFSLMRPQSVVRAPLQRFIRNLVLVILLAVVVVALVSISLVRRRLRPLTALTEATSRLARQEFEQTVAITSGDEFETLGASFNTLAQQLKRQFAELDAFNIGTLTALARAIDAKSHWTAGHSERVTSSAIVIAEAMGLPRSEVDEIRKGGLVHDIGKIATPPEILDKDGPLTKDEERIIRLHPEQGVHILEPIPAFGPILPIVGQHHERWDGSGYPRRLAGLNIARTARVLAVADVYDALRSNRPYRRGLGHAQVVDIIREESGAHFDPAVVEAFLRVEGCFAGDGVPPVALAG
jgi:putative nucleotidyltransferase with HDIG domain